MTEELLKLAKRVEALSGPDREVDELIERAVGKYSAFSYYTLGDDDQSDYIPTRYTTSLDAALTLRSSGWTIAHICEEDDKRWFAELRHGFKTSYDHVAMAGKCATPALALCAAALRALAKEK